MTIIRRRHCDARTVLKARKIVRYMDAAVRRFIDEELNSLIADAEKLRENAVLFPIAAQKAMDYLVINLEKGNWEKAQQNCVTIAESNGAKFDKIRGQAAKLALDILEFADFLKKEEREQIKRENDPKALEGLKKSEVNKRQRELAKVQKQEAKEAEKARLKAEKEAEKERIKAEKLAEKARLKEEAKQAKQAEKDRIKAEKEAEKKRIAEEKKKTKEAERKRIAEEKKKAKAEQKAKKKGAKDSLPMAIRKRRLMLRKLDSLIARAQ